MADKPRDTAVATNGIIGHEVDELLTMYVNKETLAELRTRLAASIAQRGLTLDDETFRRAANALTDAIGERLHEYLSEPQIHELQALDDRGDILSAIAWLNSHIPDYRTIVITEIDRISRATEHYVFQKSFSRSYQAALHEELNESTKSVTTKRSMEVATLQIIQQAEAESIRQAETPTRPAPDTKAELGAIATDATHLDEVLTALRERDIPLTITEVEAAITGLHRIASRSDDTAWRLGLHAVEKGLISQTQLAVLMEVGQSTVSRRYRESGTD